MSNWFECLRSRNTRTNATVDNGFLHSVAVHHGRAVVLAGKADLSYDARSAANQRSSRACDRLRRADLAAVAITHPSFPDQCEISGRSLYVRKSRQVAGLVAVPDVDSPSCRRLPWRGRAWRRVLYGSILGDVKDASGASVPGATVVVTNTSTGLAREAVTDQAGRFTFGDLPAGVYSFKASQQGFKTFEQTEVTVTHQQRLAR